MKEHGMFNMMKRL